MKRLLFLVTLLGSLNASAQTDASAKAGANSVSALASFSQGGFNFGAAFEHLYTDSMGIDGHIRIFNRDSKAPGTSDGLLIVGVGAAHHFYKKSWDLALTPSLNIINVDPASSSVDDKTTFGPGMTISLLCQWTPHLAFGVDWANYWVWFDSDFAGKRVDDLAVKAQYSF